MAQEWTTLAIKLKDNRNILIGEVDCTQHNQVCSDQAVQGYPTINLYKNGQRVSEYNEKRSVDAFMEFLSSYIQHEEL